MKCFDIFLSMAAPCLLLLQLTAADVAPIVPGEVVVVMVVLVIICISA